MPHSSGGGSHGGGFHGGSFHGGGSFSRGSRSVPDRSGPIVSNTYRSGYHRYVIYHGTQPTYFYSRGAVTEKDARPKIAGPIILLLFALLFLCISVGIYYRSPKKLSLPYDSAVRVTDRAGVLTAQDEAQLKDVFTRFQEETGITPAFLSVSPDEWKGRYSRFTNFAYDAYVNLFHDESHWLLCYSGDASADFDDWVWEAMQGDNTDGILTEKVADTFTQSVQKYLTARTRYTVGQAFCQGFEDILPGLMKTGFRFDPDESDGTIGITVILLVISVVWLISSLRQARMARDKVGAVRCPTDQGKVQEDTCEYCGGVYVHGIHIRCPHCGAPIQAASDAQA